MSFEEMVKGTFSNGFWKGFNIGHVVLIGLILIGYGRFSEQFSELKATQSAQQTQMDYMNKNGTGRSHEVDTDQQTQINELNRRVNNDEQILQQLVPRIERIDANLVILMNRK